MSYWHPSRGGGWGWTPGNPPQYLVDQWGRDALTDPEVTPAGAHVPKPDAPKPDPERRDYPYGGFWEPNQGGAHWVTMPPGSYNDRWKLMGLSWEQATNPDRNPRTHGDNPQYRGQYLSDGSPNPYYVAPDVNAPTLTVQGGWPPDLTGTLPPPPDGTPKPTPGDPPPSHPAWSVDGSSILACEQDILTAATAATQQYAELAGYVASTKWWIFSAGDPSDLEWHSRSGTVTWDPNLATTYRLTSASDNLLLTVADAIHAAGAYIEGLNAAGQIYSRSDLDSFLPET